MRKVGAGRILLTGLAAAVLTTACPNPVQDSSGIKLIAGILSDTTTYRLNTNIVGEHNYFPLPDGESFVYLGDNAFSVEANLDKLGDEGILTLRKGDVHHIDGKTFVTVVGFPAEHTADVALTQQYYFE